MTHIRQICYSVQYYLVRSNSTYSIVYCVIASVLLGQNYHLITHTFIYRNSGCTRHGGGRCDASVETWQHILESTITRSPALHCNVTKAALSLQNPRGKCVLHKRAYCKHKRHVVYNMFCVSCKNKFCLLHYPCALSPALRDETTSNNWGKYLSCNKQTEYM